MPNVSTIVIIVNLIFATVSWIQKACKKYGAAKLDQEMEYDRPTEI